MLKKNIKEILQKNNTKGQVTISPFNKDEGLVPSQLVDLDLEKKQIELLRSQAKGGMTVNSFLSNKYTDGNEFTVAKENTYDNSKERINAGISYEYHVFYPQAEYTTYQRPPNSWIITNKLTNPQTGDNYYYHFPIHNFEVDGTMYYRLDLTNEIVTTSGQPIAPDEYQYNDQRLFAALQNLSFQIKQHNPNINEKDYKVLQDNYFIDENGKLSLDVTNGVLVEKYFLKLDAKKRYNSMQYLNKLYAPDKPVKPKKVDTDSLVDKSSDDLPLNVEVDNIFDDDVVVDDVVVDDIVVDKKIYIPDDVMKPSPKKVKKEKVVKKEPKIKLSEMRALDKTIMRKGGSPMPYIETVGTFDVKGKLYTEAFLSEILDEMKLQGYQILIFDQRPKEKALLTGIGPFFLLSNPKTLYVIYLKNSFKAGALNVVSSSTKVSMNHFIERINKGFVSALINNEAVVENLYKIGFEKPIVNDSQIPEETLKVMGERNFDIKQL